MLEKVALCDCIGKTLKYADLEDEYGIFTFTDGTFTILRATAPYEDACEINICNDYEDYVMDCYFSAAGIASEEELALARQERIRMAAETLERMVKERELREYERLKAIYETKIQSE
jgi:hypothetical protein